MWFACKPAKIEGENRCSGERVVIDKRGYRGVWQPLLYPHGRRLNSMVRPTDTSIAVVAEEITVHQLSSHLA
jgi:hypothetical protein